MGLRFYLKGTSLDAHVSYSGKTAAPFGNIVDDPVVTNNANAGVFGGQVINFIAASVSKGLIYPGILNVGALSNSGAFAVRIRIVPSTTANPFLGFAVQVGNANGSHGRGYRAGITSGGKPYVQIFDLAGNTTTHIGTTTITSTINVPFDFMVSWDGTTTANAIKFSIDGAQIETITAGIAHSAGRIVKACNSLVIGSVTAGPTGIRASVNDLAIWDTAENHVYSVRTDFDVVDAFDGLLNTSPGEATVVSGQTWYLDGVLKTGTLLQTTAADIWDYLTSAISTSGSIGKLLKDNIDAAVSTRLADADYTAPANSTISAIAGYLDTEIAEIKERTDRIPDDPADQSLLEAHIDAAEAAIIAEVNEIPEGGGITPTQVADAVWDAALGDYATGGTFGEFVQKLITFGKYLGLMKK